MKAAVRSQLSSLFHGLSHRDCLRISLYGIHSILLWTPKLQFPISIWCWAPKLNMISLKEPHKYPMELIKCLPWPAGYAFANSTEFAALPSPPQGYIADSAKLAHWGPPLLFWVSRSLGSGSPRFQPLLLCSITPAQIQDFLIIDKYPAQFGFRSDREGCIKSLSKEVESYIQ